MSKPVLVDLDFGSAARARGLPNAQLGGDAVPLAQLQMLLEGNSWKDSVRVASTANLTLTGPGAAIDNINLAPGDRVLVKDQTSQPTNGLYIWNGAAVAMTRADDASTFDELEAATVRVEEGDTNKGTKWVQTQVNGTLGTSNVIFISDSGSAPPASETQAGVAQIASQAEVDAGTDNAKFVTPQKLANAAGRKLKVSQTIGDGSATSFNIDHGFNTRDVTVAVYKNAGSYDEVLADVTRPSVNRVTVTFAAAPAASGFRVVVIG